MRHEVTLYDTLGVNQDASEEDIRVAFRGLTRKFHPDRFSGEQREKAEERFQTITEAFNVLSRPESRETYDKGLAASGGSSTSKGADPRELSKRLAAKGAEEFRAGNLQQALEHLKMAIDHHEDNSRAHYFYGVALSRIGGRERDGLRHLERASSLEPNNATMKAEAAAVSLAVGMTSRASRLAEEAIALDPTQRKAAAVLQKLENPADGNSEGLLGRLRKKG
jgi:molecular chaperone DnaJ